MQEHSRLGEFAVANKKDFSVNYPPVKCIFRVDRYSYWILKNAQELRYVKGLQRWCPERSGSEYGMYFFGTGIILRKTDTGKR
jgi:hypothetical protein